MPGRKRVNLLSARISIIQILFYINTFVWFCFSIYTIMDMMRQNTLSASLLAGFFLFVNAGAMFASARFLEEKESWAYYFSVVVLILNMLVTRIGQFGFFDLLALFFDLVILGSLISIGKAYLKKS